MAASIGFTLYSALLGNVVFTVTNSLMLVSAVVGQCLYWRNQRHAPAIVEAVADHAGIPIAKPKRPRSGAKAAGDKRTAPTSRRRRSSANTNSQ